VKIADLPRKTHSSGNIQDFASQLGPSGIKKLFSLMYEAYTRTKASGKIVSNMTEPEITEELYTELIGVCIENGDSSIRPIHEKAHKKIKKSPGRTPTIDLCFRDEWDSESYLGFECKKLENNDKSRLDDYIKGGICRFLTGAYSKKCSIGSMIGYIIDENIEKIASEIKSRVDNTSCNQKMERTTIINGHSEQYKSGHSRIIDKSPFVIFHLFFSFNHNE
jgi:hypothetical protein